jgi:site-specific DNA-methyltransferase (adenine-specific)
MNIPKISLYNNDCLIEMSNIPDKSIDMILCDLPYGTTKCEWDSILPFDELWKHYNRIIKDNGAIVLFGQEPFSSFLRVSNIKNYRYDIYWEKERITNIMQVKRRVGKNTENISIFYKNQPTYNPQMVTYHGPKRGNKVKHGKLGKLVDDSNTKTVKEYVDNGLRYPTQIWKYQRDILTSNLHPTQKPVLLLEDLIKTFTNEGETVLDNCMGSGSTGIACLNTNRNFIGIENDTNMFNIAKNRINIRINELNNTEEYEKQN